MSEYLISWLNNEIYLSKKITNIPEDFSNGYLFAELFYKTKQLPSLKNFKNSSNNKEILQNFSLLEPYFRIMNIEINENNKYKIINKDIYTSILYLLKIKQVLDRKCINLKQLKLKNLHNLSNLYNSIYFKKNREKYILNNNISMPKLKNKNSEKKLSYNRSNAYIDENKNNNLVTEIRRNYSNLNLDDLEIELIGENIENNKNKYKLLRKNIYNIEQKRKKINLETETNNFSNWLKINNKIKEFKINQIHEKNKLSNYYRNSVKKEFKIINNSFQKLSKDFDYNLSFFQKTSYNNNINENKPLLLSQIAEKLNQKLKSKNLKERKERKIQREEQNHKFNSSLNTGTELNKSNFENLITQEINEENNTKNNLKVESYRKVSLSMKNYNNDFRKDIVKNAKLLHWNNIKIGNRIDFFKTKMFKKENINKENLPQINFNKNDKYSSFDKDYFFECLNKEDYLINKNQLLNKLDKKKKKREEISIIFEKILNLTNYVSVYQSKNKIELLEDEKWKELMNEFVKEEDKQESNNNYEKNLKNHEINKDYLLEQEFYDYINYTGIFNDLIIPYNNDNKYKNGINKEYSFAEIYSEFYMTNKKENLDIKEHEPNKEEYKNLIYPQYPDYDKNVKLNDIILHIIENKLNNDEDNKNFLKAKEKGNNIIDKKGKFFYLPIKICLIGYPMSGKNVQSKLLNEKFPGIRIYDPTQLLKDKIKEYNEININLENISNNKKHKSKKSEELNKQKEEKIKKFEPIYNIISPILNNNQNDNHKDIAKIKSDIYLKLLIYELNKDYPEDKEKKLSFIKELKEKYNEYKNINKKINEINSKIKDEEGEKINNKKNDKNKKENKTSKHQKEILKLNKELELIKTSLFKGFVIINFPTSEYEAKLLENYFNGFISEYEKEQDSIEKKINNYDYIIYYNIKKGKKDEKQFSFLDYVINLDINSNEIERRYKGIKYDPNTKQIYHEEDNPPPLNDKKVISRLISGLPNKSKDDIKDEKEKYDLNSLKLSKFYKRMYNGVTSVYSNIDCMNKNKENINEQIIFNMENYLFKFYFENIELIIDKINDNNKTEKKEDYKIINNDLKGQKFSKISSTNVNSFNKEKTNYILKDLSIDKNIINNLYKKFTIFADSYKFNIKSVFKFMKEQKKGIFNYLNKMQDLFIKYLDRKTDKIKEVEMFIKKYNTIIIKYNSLKNNDIIYNELLNDINYIKNLLWNKILLNKEENEKYVNNIKKENIIQKETKKFWDCIKEMIENEINKYIILCEIILKYYLSKIGIIYREEDINNENYFYFDYKKILYNEIEINEREIELQNQNDYLNESNFDIILKNVLKIIIKEDELIKKYQDIINTHIKQEINKNLFNEQKSKSVIRKSIQTLNKSIKVPINDSFVYNEDINKIIIKEKNRLKYRILFIKYFYLKYQNIINKCFTETFNEMDKWITLKITGQNNLLNEYINYLKENLNNINKKSFLKNFDFDENNFDKIKVNLSIIYDKIYIKEILDIYNTPIEHKLLQIENLTYSESFIYNLKDLLYIYNSLKDFGSSTNNYIVKYNIVYELFIKKYLIHKGFRLLVNNNEDQILNQNNTKRSLILNYKENSNIISNKDSNSTTKLISNISTNRSKNNIYENLIKGIPKKLINLSHFEYHKFLSIFAIFDNKYININELFTILLIIGSELISPKAFLDDIKNKLFDGKKDERILLTKEEFMNIKFWFEDDEYLNIPCDEEEKELYINFDEIDNEIYNKEYKIKKIKESIFEINKEENLFDIEIYKNVLEKLNKRIKSYNSNNQNNEKILQTKENKNNKKYKFIRKIQNNIFDSIFKN